MSGNSQEWEKEPWKTETTVTKIKLMFKHYLCLKSKYVGIKANVMYKKVHMPLQHVNSKQCVSNLGKHNLTPR
jgi:hypothetical protein